MSERRALRERRRLRAALASLVLGTLLVVVGTGLPVLVTGVVLLLAFVVVAATALLSPARVSKAVEDG